MSRMAKAVRVTTADELLQITEDHHHYELLHGELSRRSLPVARRGVISTELLLRLGTWAKRHDLGLVTDRVGFLLDQDPDHVRAPDVAFIRKERLPETGVPVKYWPGAPDFCAEVVSCNDTYAYVQEKACDWIRYGTRLVVVVEPDRRRLVVHRSDKDVQILGEDDVLDGGDVVPDFELAIRELFQG